MATQGTATIDFGATPVNTATFAIVDATLAGLTYSEAWVMRDVTGQNDADAHEQLGSYARFTTSISGTTLTVWVELILGFVTGQFSLRYVAN